MLIRSLNSEFPKPSKENWEKEYIYAYATSDVVTRLINTIQNAGSYEDFQERMDKFIAGAVDEA